MDFIEPCFGIGHNLSLICQMTSEDIKHQLIIIITYHMGEPSSVSVLKVMVLDGRFVSGGQILDHGGHIGYTDN